MALTVDTIWLERIVRAPIEVPRAPTRLCGLVDAQLTATDVLDLEFMDFADLDADAVVDVITVSQALIGRVEAIQLRAVEELRRRRGDDRDAADEVMLARSVSKHVADRQVRLGRELTHRLPKVLAAMGRGELDAYKASRIVETALPLDDDLARELDDHLDGRLAGRDASAIQQSVRYRVDRLDPDGAARRAERRRRDRKVEFLPGQDGMADLVGYLPADVASAAYARIDAIAKSVKTRWDERTLDEIRRTG